MAKITRDILKVRKQVEEIIPTAFVESAPTIAKVKTVILDAGHGSNNRSFNKFDPGATNGTWVEASLTWRTSCQIYDLLCGYKNIEAILTRVSSNSKASLFDRVELANKKNADLFVSIHFNSSVSKEAHGFEVWTTKGQTKSDLLAEHIYQNIAERLGDKITVRREMSDHDSDKESNFYVLNNTKMPAVLIEMAFISNEKEMQFFYENHEEYIKAVAKAIVEF